MAIETAREICQRQDYQLLDNSVFFQSLSIIRLRRGSLGFQRLYQFEYSEDFDTRKQGFVIMHGKQVESSGLMEGIQ